MLKVQPSNVITFQYTNYKGVVSSRNATVIGLHYGSTEYHPETQWLLEGFDLDKNVIRVYALKDMTDVKRTSARF